MKPSSIFLIGGLAATLLIALLARVVVHVNHHDEFQASLAELEPTSATDEDYQDYEDPLDKPGFKVDASTYAMMVDSGDMPYTCEIEKDETPEEEEVYRCIQAGGRRLAYYKYLKLARINLETIWEIFDCWQTFIMFVELYTSTFRLTERKGHSTSPNTLEQVLEQSFSAKNEWEDLLHYSTFDGTLHVYDHNQCQNGNLHVNKGLVQTGGNVRGCNKQYPVLTPSLKNAGWLCIDYGPNPTRIYLALKCGAAENVALKPLISSVHEAEWGGTEWYGIKTIFDAYFFSHFTQGTRNFYIWKTRVVADYDESKVDDDDW